MDEETAIIIYTGDQALDTPLETPPQDAIYSLEQAIEAWIAESSKKKTTAYSAKTETAYRSTLTEFRAYLQEKHLDLDHFPPSVANAAREWLNTSKAERVITWSTFNNRRSILSSFYKFALRNDVLDSNPIERIPAQKIGAKNAAHYLPDAQVKASLRVINRSTVEGLRDYALLSIALTTGHRSSELAGLRLSHLTFSDASCLVRWERCKGNKQMTSRLERGVTKALYAYLTDRRVYGSRLLTMPGDKPVWLSFSDRNREQAIGTRTISNICARYLGDSRVHVTRHTAAVNLKNAGASLEQVRQFLGHSNAKTTSDYLEEQLGYVNPFAEQLEAAFGIE